MSRRLHCQNNACKNKFSEHDPRVVSQLPPEWQHAFPAVLTKRSGIDKKVLFNLRASIAEGMGPEPFYRILKENHMRRYYQLQISFMSNLYAKLKAGSVITLKPKYPEFHDNNGYGGFYPSSRYLVNVYTMLILMHEPSLLGQIAKASGKVLKIDFSHKVTYLLYLILT